VKREREREREMSRKVRGGIIGTGKVSNDFVLSLRHVEEAEIVMCAARSVEKARAFAKAHEIRVAGETYEDVYESDDVDVVYVGTIHPCHYDQVKACLMNGKHVLCEKPMTMSASRTKELVELSGKRGLMLQEGMWTRFFPAIQEIRKRIDSNEIGEVMCVQSSFGVLLDWESDKKHRCLNKALGGSAILDIGVYPLNHALFVFAKHGMPEIAVSGVTRNNVDISVSASLKFADRYVASLTCSVAADLPNETIFVGTKGQIVLSSPSHAPTRITLKIRKARGEFKVSQHEFCFPEALKKLPYNFPNSQGFFYEARAVTQALLQKKCIPAMKEYYSHEESILCAKITDAMRQALKCD